MEIKGNVASFFLLGVSAFLIAGCASGTCNNIPQRPPASDTSANQNGTANVSPGPAPTPSPAAPSLPATGVVQVFKPTGEKQCKMGKATAIDEFQNSLTEKKIPVYEAHTQADGLMHMALCGAPSGTIHVFTIPKKDLKKAEKLGFRLFRQQ